MDSKTRGYFTKIIKYGITNGTVLSYFFDETGKVCYSINGEEKPVISLGVNLVAAKLWALLDVYGNTIGVEFSNDALLPISVSQNAKSSLVLTKKLAPFAFNAIKSPNVRLSNDR